MSSSATVAKRKKAQRMAVILPNVPKGVNWGWYSREDTRMHLQTVDSKNQNAYRVWLERDGKRVFEPANSILTKILKKLEMAVKERRRNIEGRWVNFMIAQDWLELHVSGTLVTVVAYPHVPGSRFTRTVDLVEWLPGIYNPRSQVWPPFEPVKPEEVVLSKELPAIEIYPQKDESLRHHFFLPTILWEG
jgi:hypothetical protein